MTVQVKVNTFIIAGKGSFNPGLYNVTFPAGSTNASLNISLNYDFTYTFIWEYVFLRILKDSLPSCARFGDTSSATIYIYILNNDVRKLHPVII